MKDKPNKMAAAGLFVLLAGTTSAQVAAAEGEQPEFTEIINTVPSKAVTDMTTSEQLSEDKPDNTAQTPVRPIRRGYGIGYEYRMRHRNEMSRPMHTQRPERPERPEHSHRMERPERPERPATAERPERPERPGRHGQ